MINSKEKVFIAELPFCPSFALAAFAIFRIERGKAADVAKVYEYLENEKYKVEDPVTKRVEERQRQVRKYLTFTSDYFFNTETTSHFNINEFCFVRELSNTEALYENYLTQIDKAKSEALVQKEQQEVMKGGLEA